MTIMSTLRLLTRLHNNTIRLCHVQQKQAWSWKTQYLLRTCTGSFFDNANRNCQTARYEINFWACNRSSIHNFSTKIAPDQAGKTESKSAASGLVKTEPVVSDSNLFGDNSKLSLFAKFKLMYKQYWYVLLPVHVVTSIGWFGAFYYLSKSGVDVVALLQSLHISETIINKVQHSDMGHLAIAFLCYKVAAPLRYAVTLGGTTLSIKHLVQLGYIKPMPTKDQIIQMYEDRKATRAAAKDKAAAEARADKEK